MVPQSPNYYILLSSLISGIMLLISIYINNKFQLKREQEQRIWQEKSEKQTWYREKIYGCYKRSIQVVTKMVQEDFTIAVYDKQDNSNNIVTTNKRIELVNLRWEFNAEFALIESDYPDKISKNLEEKITKMEEYLDTKPIAARVILIQIMEQDSRIKI